MSNHFTAVGFAADHDTDIPTLVTRAAREGRNFPAGQRYYRVWTPGEGVGLWVGVDTNHEILGCDPSFSGHGRMRLGVESLMTAPPTYAPLEGGLYGWADPPEGDPASGLYPVIVDIPGFELFRPSVVPPRIVTLQVSCFAHSLDCFRTDEEFLASQEGTSSRGTKFSPEFFIPSGLFGSEGPGQAYATFAGHVQGYALRTNPVSRRRFHHVLARNAAGLFDIVADPALVRQEPVIGGVVRGEFWLSGRVIESP